MSFKTLWRRTGRTVSALVIVGAVAGFVVPLFAGTWIALDVLSSFRVHFFGMLAAGALAFMSARLWPLVLVLGVVLTPVAAGLLPFLSLASSGMDPPADGEAVVVAAAYNMQHRHSDADAIERFLRETDAGIVILLETSGDKLAVLDRLNDVFPYREDCLIRRRCGMVMLSKHRIVGSGVKVDWDGSPLVWMTFGPERGRLTVVGTHIHRMRSIAPSMERQWDHIKALATQSRSFGQRLIVAGDFNATRFSFMLDAFEEMSGLSRVTAKPTWPSWFFNLPQLDIDHIFVSDGVRPLAAPEVGDAHGSDHLPVIGRFAISPAGP